MKSAGFAGVILVAFTLWPVRAGAYDYQVEKITSEATKKAMEVRERHKAGKAANEEAQMKDQNVTTVLPTDKISMADPDKKPVAYPVAEDTYGG